MRRGVCAVLFYAALVAVAAGVVLAGLATWQAVAIVVLIALLRYAIDRLILAAMPDLRPRRDQDIP